MPDYDSAKPEPAVDSRLADLAAVSDARFHSLAYMVEQAVIVTDASNIVRFANPAADQLFECAPGRMSGLFLLPMRSTKSGVVEIVLPSGRLARLSAQISATVWDGGIGWLGTFREVTKELPDARAIEDTLQSMRARFLAHLSHEMRTPLNSIIGFSEAMAVELFGPLGSERYGDYVRTVLGEAERLLQLTNDLLDLSRAESADLRIDESVFDLAEVILELAPHARTLSRGGKARISFGAVEPVLLRADRDKIRAVLAHLVGNGLAFTPASGTVTVSAELTSERRLVIRVIDTGRGFDADQLAQAFRPFPRVLSAELADPQSGIGVGLALVRRYIELHGGAVRIESEPGQGTTVTCMLPSDRVALDVKAPPTAH